jgi:hypothetical protein
VIDGWLLRARKAAEKAPRQNNGAGAAEKLPPCTAQGKRKVHEASSLIVGLGTFFVLDVRPRGTCFIES